MTKTRRSWTITIAVGRELCRLPISWRLWLVAIVAVAGSAGCTGSVMSPSGQHTATASLQSTTAVSPSSSTTQTLAPTPSTTPKPILKSTPTGSMHTARIGATATLLQNGKVLITGGSSTAFGNIDSAIYSSAELYDPVTGTFSKTGSMGSARTDHTATLLADGEVLITGGMGCSPSRSCSHVSGSAIEQLASAELYDPSTAKFSRTGSMSASRAYGTATILTDGRVLVAEGADGPTQTAELYDPKTGKFLRAAKEPAFDNAKATRLANGKVLVTGDASYLGIGAEVYDETSNKFEKVSIALAPGKSPKVQYKGEEIERYSGPGLLLRDGKVLIFQSGYLETYDPTTALCADAGFISPAGQWLVPSATELPDGRVLFVGGQLMVDPVSYVVVTTNSFVVYDPISKTADTGAIKTARIYSTSTVLPNGSVLIAGGQDANEKPLASAELLEP